MGALSLPLVIPGALLGIRPLKLADGRTPIVSVGTLIRGAIPRPRLVVSALLAPRALSLPAKLF